MKIHDLFPDPGWHVFPTFYPPGWQVAKHDAEGFAHELRWFPTLGEAEAHLANVLKTGEEKP